MSKKKRIEAEKRLKESEERYKRITENIIDVVWVADKDLKIEFVSPSIKKLTGETPEIHMDKTMEEKFTPESLNKIYTILQEELEKEKDPNQDKNRTRLIEAEHYRIDGSKIWVSMNVSFLRDNKGNIIGFQGLTRDINDRKIAEIKLREKTELLQNITDNMFDLVSLTDLNGNYKFAGKSHEILGYDLDSLIDTSVLEYVHPQDLPRVKLAFIEFINKKKDNSKVEYRYRCADGSYIWLETMGKLLKDKNGNTKEILFSSRNITERKEQEKALIESEKKHKILLKEIHHRVKNNLQTVNSILNLQSLQIDDEKTLSVFSNAKNRIRAMALVHEKLYGTKNLDSIELKNYLSSLLNSLIYSSSSNEKIELTTDIEETSIELDKAIPLGLILNEVITNSLKHGINNIVDPKLIIKSKQEKGKISLSVKDNGKGLPIDFNIKETDSLGWQLITMLTNELDGDYKINNENGLEVIISIPV